MTTRSSDPRKWALTDGMDPPSGGGGSSRKRHVEVVPGDLVVCDQLVDWTRGRRGTFYDGPRTRHISFAEPYGPWMREIIVAVARRLEMSVHEAGTMVVVEGPRFSTAAESQIFARLGCSVINMTGCPAALARELALGYATIALITDHDAGILAEFDQNPVTQEARGPDVRRELGASTPAAGRGHRRAAGGAVTDERTGPGRRHLRSDLTLRIRACQRPQLGFTDSGVARGGRCRRALLLPPGQR